MINVMLAVAFSGTNALQRRPLARATFSLSISLALACFSAAVFAGPVEDMREILQSKKAPVLLVVDTQESYFKLPESRMPGMIEMSENIVESIEFAAENNIRTIAITFLEESKGAIEGSIKQTLIRARYEWYSKSDYSAFLTLTCQSTGCETALSELINPDNDALLVEGIADGCCVYETVKDALEEKFTVYVNRDTNIIDSRWPDLAKKYQGDEGSLSDEGRFFMNKNPPQKNCTI